MQVVMHDEKLVVIAGETQKEIPISLHQADAMRDLLGAGAMREYQDALTRLIDQAKP